MTDQRRARDCFRQATERLQKEHGIQGRRGLPPAADRPRARQRAARSRQPDEPGGALLPRWRPSADDRCIKVFERLSREDNTEPVAVRRCQRAKGLIRGRESALGFLLP